MNYKDAHVLVCTPAYNSMITLDYLYSLFEFISKGIHFDLHTIGNESLITRARNTQITYFNENKKFTHLLWLDADVHLPAEGLKLMLEADVDVIGAPVRLKNKNQKSFSMWGYKDDDGNFNRNEDGLLILRRIATGALLMSRKAVDAVIQEAEENDHWYKTDDGDKHYDVFRLEVDENRIYMSEDYFLCEKLRELGFTIYAKDNIITRHSGTMSFAGDDTLYVKE